MNVRAILRQYANGEFSSSDPYAMTIASAFDLGWEHGFDGDGSNPYSKAENPLAHAAYLMGKRIGQEDYRHAEYD